MARLSRKHRASISAGVRRYWRQVKRLAKKRHVSIEEARKHWDKKRRKIIDFIPEVLFEAPGIGIGAFDLKDRDEEYRLNLFERSAGHRTIHGELIFAYFDEPGKVPRQVKHFIEFERGADRDEFFRNYFAAVRAELSSKSPDFAILLKRLT